MNRKLKEYYYPISSCFYDKNLPSDIIWQPFDNHKLYLIITIYLFNRRTPPLTVPYDRRLRRSFYYKEQSTANSNSFKIAQKTAFEAKGRLYTTGKVIQRLFIIDLYT